ncbi:Guanylate-binding protein 1 [Camelus dromedarius]|uniref:Guanylate-binding protein 1 n=1 Tax=Camelus dromedarius TaxID=9838 RepID=A0A5N4DE11_CAMDR|nr:Guanylate-binding protein 1 [Camelus dromedarius]
MEPCCLPCVITVLVEKKKKQKTWKCMAGKIALTILSAITQPVVVVAIVGLYRTGKSYLMNKLAGKSKGFSLGSTVQSHTRASGLVCAHPQKPNRTLVLLTLRRLGCGEGTSEKDKMFNLPRLCIRKFFPNKKCFIFDRPTQRKQLSRLEELRDVELDSEFVHQAALFCAYIFSNSKTKTLSGGIKVNGPRLETLVLTYVSAISSGDLPCMENAVLALAEIENSAAVQKAIAHYDQQMDQKAQLNKKRDDFCKQNLKESSDRCKALLKDIFTTLEEGVKQGVYSKPGGYRLFMEKIQELKKQYDQEPRKGIQVTGIGSGKLLTRLLETPMGLSVLHMDAHVQGDSIPAQFSNHGRACLPDSAYMLTRESALNSQSS